MNEDACPPEPPRISVVLPCFNAERYLREAIASVLSQTFAGFELLAIDDGSTDGTLAIICEAAASDPRVVPLALAHGGIVRALTAGLEAARGEYIARMDADDICLPQRFALQAAFLDANPAVAIVGSRAIRIDAEGERISRTGALALTDAGIRHSLASGGIGLLHPAVMARRERLLAAGGYREEDLPSEDLGLWKRMRSVGQFAALPDALILKRRHYEALTVMMELGEYGLLTADFHRRIARHSSAQGFPIAARKHARKAVQLGLRSPRMVAFAAFVEVVALPALVLRRISRART